MKKIFIPIIALLITACGAPDKKAELEKLKKQERELKDQIAALEAELNTSVGANKDVSGISVSVTKAIPQVFSNYIDVLGKIDTDENIALSSEIPGTITKINVKVGENVRAGQVLAETDDRAIQQQMLDLQANIDLVNQVYERQKSLWDLKIGTEMQYLKAKADKESMSKKMAALQEQLRMTKIVTPISGVVDAIDVKIGQISSPGMPSIRVINYSNLKVKAEVAEKYASKIKKGAEVIVRLPDMNNDSIVAKVNFVSRSINPVTRTFNVEVTLDGNKEYHPNMVAGLSISDYKSEKPVIVIPVKAIQKDENNAAFVYLADGKKAKKQMVIVGEQYKGKSEIKEGLKEGDLVLYSGYDMVNEGDRISY